jgi:hypothetical protein
MASGRSVRLYFAASPYLRLIEATIEPTKDLVRVTLYAQRPAGLTPQQNAMRCAEVTLDQPLGSRRVVDGATARADGIPSSGLFGPLPEDCERVPR